MVLYAYVAFKLSGWEPIKFEYFQHEACPNLSVFLSTDRVTLDVCLTSVSLAFFLMNPLCAFFSVLSF